MTLPTRGRPARFDYERDPERIARQSFALVGAECDLGALTGGEAALASRLVHACAMPDIVADLAWGGDVAAAGRAALGAGAPILVDGRMTAAGITRARLPAANQVLCLLGDPAVAARPPGTTRSAAAVELWRPHMAGAVIAIGNAPTALFRLLEILGDGAPRPAAILAFPVGFVGAAESKEALLASGLEVPHVTLRGRRGGSALAAAAVNALAADPP